MCTTKQPATCTLKKQFQMLAGQPDKSDITVQRKFPVDQDQVDAVAQAKKTAELNAAWLSQEKADQVAELKQKKVQEESEKNDRLKKMTPKEKAAYDEAKSKANKDAVLYELNDDKALRRVKAGNGKRELDLELTSGTSLVGGALRFDCPNTVGARAESSRFADMFDFGNKDFTITARVLTRVDGPQKRFIYKRSKDEDQPGYSMMIHNNTVAFQYGRNQTIYGSSKVNDGEFHSIVVVRDTSNHEVRLYVDDQLQARAQDLSTSITNDGQFVLGGPAFNGTGFCGYLKDIGLFKRVLSKTEITEFTSDRDSKDSMTRIRNEALLSEAAQAAKEAEQSLQRSKQEAERADYKAEQEHKDKNQQAKAAVARREEQNAQAQLKQVENDWEKAQQVARTATNEANREQALWIARNLKEKMTLAEKAYDMAAEASEKEGQKAIRISIEKTKATAAEQTAKAEAAEQRAKKIKKASDLEIQAEKENCHTQPSQVGMISKWDFNGNLRDSIGALHGTAVGGAVTFENGGVLVDKGKYIKTELLTATLKARTLEVWCKLDRSLGQSKAGVMSVQTQDGSVYDSVAYGHGKKEKIWYAASNGDARTEPTPEGAPEKEDKETIHVAVTYDVGGVAIYRNGLPYRNYSKGEIASFNKDNGQILFGTMHGNGTASGHFKGTIVEARLYNRALTPTEIATSFFAYTQCPAIQASIAKDKAKKELAEKLAAESKLVAEKEVHSAKAEGLAKKHEADKLMKRSEQREKESEKNRKRRDKVEEVDTKNHLKKRHTMCRKTSNKSPSSNAGKWSWPVFSYRKGWNFVKSWSFNSRATVVGDFNGDGRSDYARLGGTYMHLFISRGDGTFWQPVYKFPKGWNFRHDESVWTTLKAIDLNGDKRADIVRLHYNSNKAFISAGSNNDCFYRDGDIPEACFRVTSFRHKVAFQGPLSWNDDKRTVVGDFNSDGRGDFARVGPNFIHFFISKGDGTFFTPSYEMPTGVNIGEKDNQWSTLVGNFNGNCQTSFIFTSGTFQHALLNVGTDLDCWNQDGWLKKNANCFKYMTMAYPRKWNISACGPSTAALPSSETSTPTDSTTSRVWDPSTCTSSSTRATVSSTPLCTGSPPPPTAPSNGTSPSTSTFGLLCPPLTLTATDAPTSYALTTRITMASSRADPMSSAGTETITFRSTASSSPPSTTPKTGTSVATGASSTTTIRSSETSMETERTISSTSAAVPSITSSSHYNILVYPLSDAHVIAFLEMNQPAPFVFPSLLFLSG